MATTSSSSTSSTSCDAPTSGVPAEEPDEDVDEKRMPVLEDSDDEEVELPPKIEHLMTPEHISEEAAERLADEQRRIEEILAHRPGGASMASCTPSSTQRVVSLFRGMKKVGPKTLLEEMDEVVAKTAPVGLLPCEVWIPEGCQLYTMGEPEFIDIEVVLDSGAGLHVGNRKHFPGYTVEPNDLSKAGAGFVAADGGVIDNQGEVLLQMTTTDGRGGEHAISSKFHVADVTRALWSVGVICDAGLEARFTSEAAVVQKPDGTPVCHFTRKKGLYITKARIRNPNFEGFRRQAS